MSKQHRTTPIIKLPDTSNWGTPDRGIKVKPRAGKGIQLVDCFVVRNFKVIEEGKHGSCAQI
ncbi:MAG: hypothetical protein D6813_15905 [Calditrichaeota bacterium]|nr:MAG: hypothetical protein D6813_15905 [Calditrichota bacterium]